MKKTIVFMILLYAVPILAQSNTTGNTTAAKHNTKLFYFTKNQNDISYVGVKNDAGKVIIPAQMRNYVGLKDGKMIKDRLLSFYGCPKAIKREKQSSGCVFDRKGNYLYQPFSYDNGADYFVEGYQRMVKNGKVGFANQNGDITITPQFDFVSPFNYGYARFCNGCYWQYLDQEHKVITGGQWGVINFKGEKVSPFKEKKRANDVKIKNKYYPYPFSYTKKEQKILAFFHHKMKLLASIEYVNLANKLEEDKKILYFEMVERPSESFPFYRVVSYDYRKYHEKSFLVSANGDNVYYVNFFGEKTPFKQWLATEIKSAKDYQKRNPTNPNKFVE